MPHAQMQIPTGNPRIRQGKAGTVTHWHPYSGVAAILAAFGLVAFIVVEFIGPDPSWSVRQIAGVFQHDPKHVQLAAVLGVIWPALYLVWLCGWQDILRQSEGEGSVLSTLALASGVIGVTLFMVFIGTYGALATSIGQHANASLLYGFDQAAASIDTLDSIFFGLVVAVSSLSLVRTLILSRGLAWFGLVSGSAWALGGFSFLSPAGGSLGFIDFLGTVLSLVWFLLVGIGVLRRSSSRFAVTNVSASSHGEETLANA